MKKYPLLAITLWIALFVIGLAIGRMAPSIKTVRFSNAEQDLVNADRVMVVNLSSGASMSYVGDREFVREVALWTNQKIPELPGAEGVGQTAPSYEIHFLHEGLRVISYQFHEGDSLVTGKSFLTPEDIELFGKWVEACSR